MFKDSIDLTEEKRFKEWMETIEDKLKRVSKSYKLINANAQVSTCYNGNVNFLLNRILEYVEELESVSENFKNLAYKDEPDHISKVYYTITRKLGVSKVFEEDKMKKNRDSKKQFIKELITELIHNEFDD